MPLDEIYQIIHSGKINGEGLQNVYFYRVNTGTPSALDLSLAFQEDIVPEILAFTQNNVVYDRIRVINLGDLTDFADGAHNDVGVGNVNMLPPHDAVAMTFRTDTRAVRPGGKRYSGLASAAVVDGTITDATSIGLINALAVAIGSIIAYDTEPVATYKPIVLKRVKEVDEDDKVTYRLPETDMELAYGNVTGVLVDLKISHQNTRSNGQ